VAVVLTAAMGLALVASLLQDVQTGSGGVAVLESSGERIARLEVSLLCCGASFAEYRSSPCSTPLELYLSRCICHPSSALDPRVLVPTSPPELP